MDFNNAFELKKCQNLSAASQLYVPSFHPFFKGLPLHLLTVVASVSDPIKWWSCNMFAPFSIAYVLLRNALPVLRVHLFSLNQDSAYIYSFTRQLLHYRVTEADVCPIKIAITYTLKIHWFIRCWMHNFLCIMGKTFMRNRYIRYRWYESYFLSTSTSLSALMK